MCTHKNKYATTSTRTDERTHTLTDYTYVYILAYAHIVRTCHTYIHGHMHTCMRMNKQVGEHTEFSISRSKCRSSGSEFVPPDQRPSLIILADYVLNTVQAYPPGKPIVVRHL